MDQIKKNIAENICALRQQSGFTQLELAEKLNYTDKAISKWERADSTPDITVLKRIADMFGVTVDFLLCDPEHTAPKIKTMGKKKHSRLVISLLSTMLIWIIAAVLFFGGGLIFGMSGKLWLIFLAAVPASSIVLLVFNSVWGNHKYNYYIISLLVWSLLATIYTYLIQYNLWTIFLLGVPAQIVIFLWSKLKFKRNTPESKQK